MAGTNERRSFWFPEFSRGNRDPNRDSARAWREVAHIHRLPAKWNDGETFTVEVHHRPGSKDLSFSSGHVYLHELVENQTLGLALNWYREDYVAWRFDLTGAGEALADAGCQ